MNIIDSFLEVDNQEQTISSPGTDDSLDQMYTLELSMGTPDISRHSTSPTAARTPFPPTLEAACEPSLASTLAESIW